MKFLQCIVVAAATLLYPWTAVVPVKADDAEETLEPVNVSIQVSFMAIPFHIGKDKGYYRDLGLDVSAIVYPSGAPQVNAAFEDDAWEIGIAGVVPNIIGGDKGLTGIGICFDQSAINQLVANKAGVDAWPLQSFDGVKIASSPNSTGDFVVQACLKEQGYDIDKIDFVYEQQAEIIDALTPDENGTAVANFGGLWAPNTYKFFEANNGSDTICSGATVYATVTGGFMAREEWAVEHEETVNRLLAAWLRGIVFMKDEANREEVFDYMEEFYSENGLELSRNAMAEDMRLIGLFELDEQLEKMERSGDPPSSQYDFSTLLISQFMKDNGVVSEYREPIDYITDKYMKNIKADPILNKYARGEEVDLSDLDYKDPGAGTSGVRAMSLAMTLMGLVTMMPSW